MQKFRGSAYLLTACIAGACVASYAWHPAPPPRYTGLNEVRQRLPDNIAGFTLRGDNPVSEPVRAALAAADLVSRTYADNRGTIDVTLIGGTDRSALHDPRSCLIGAGWRIEDDHTVTLPSTNGKPGPLARACRVVSDTSGETLEVLYLYVVNGQIVNEVTQIRSQMLFSALIGRKNTPVCFVRFMRPISTATGTSAEQTTNSNQTRFMAFAGQMWERLQIPQTQAPVVNVPVAESAPSVVNGETL